VLDVAFCISTVRNEILKNLLLQDFHKPNHVHQVSLYTCCSYDNLQLTENMSTE